MSPAEFLSFYGLLNFYLYTLAFVYSPSKNALYGKLRPDPAHLPWAGPPWLQSLLWTRGTRWALTVSPEPQVAPSRFCVVTAPHARNERVGGP